MRPKRTTGIEWSECCAPEMLLTYTVVQHQRFLLSGLGVGWLARLQSLEQPDCGVLVSKQKTG